MLRKLVLLFFLLLLLLAPDAAAAGPIREVVLRADVAIEHPSARRELRPLELLAHEEPVDALEALRARFRQSRAWRDALLPQLCSQPSVRCSRRGALLATQRVVLDARGGSAVLEILDDEEPVDQVLRFVIDHALVDDALPQLRAAVCGLRGVVCARETPLVYTREVAAEDGQSLGRLEIALGDEPADAVLAFAAARGLGRGFRQELLRHVCATKYARCTRQQAVVFSAPIRVDKGSHVGVLRLFEDEELADAVYHFARETNITYDLRASLFETLCYRDGITCTRGQALLRELPVSAGEQSQHLGVIRVFEGQEPADVVHAFAQQHGLSSHDELTLVETLCGTSATASGSSTLRGGGARPEVELECSRYAPVVFAVPVAAQNGSRLGILEVLLNEEPADAIARFGNKHGLGSDEKLNIWQAVCEASGLPCSRSRGLIYQTVYTVPDALNEHGEPVRELLAFMDGEEPTDVIYEYGKMRNLTLRQRKALLHSVCNEPRRRPNCTRAEPMLLQIPVWETQHKKMGDLEILEGQEPIDMVYAFLEKHDLFQTEPLNTTLLETVCNSTRVMCARSRPRKILFSMQATYAGISHSLQYVRPETDWICEQQPLGGQTCVHYVEILAKEFCATHMYDWRGCDARILEALRSQLEVYETHMWRGKDLYAKLGLIKSASREEIDAAYNTLVKRFNNETEPYKYEKLREAYATLSDPEDKYFYDLPCLKLFGLCGKKKKDGSISITPD